MQKLPEISFAKTTRSSLHPNLVALQSNPDHVPTKAELDKEYEANVARAVKQYNSSNKSLRAISDKYGVSKDIINRYFRLHFSINQIYVTHNMCTISPQYHKIFLTIGSDFRAKTMILVLMH